MLLVLLGAGECKSAKSNDKRLFSIVLSIAGNFLRKRRQPSSIDVTSFRRPLVPFVRGII